MRFRFFPVFIITLFFVSCRTDVEMNELQKVCFQHTGNALNLVGDTIGFLNCSEYAGQYQWNFGDGSGSRVQNPWHVYDESGNYIVSLSIMSNGFEHTAYDTVVVKKKSAPCFNVQHHEFPKNGFPVIFENCSTNGESFFWDFGDGGTSADVNPKHVYDKPGQYWVTLKAFSNTDTAETAQQILIDHHFEDYMETEQGFYPLEKARLLKGYFYNKRFCFQLGTSHAQFVDDEIVGKGYGLIITGSGDFKPDGYSGLKAFYCYSADGELQMQKEELKGININWVKTPEGDGILINGPGINAFFKEDYLTEVYKSYPSVTELEKFVRGSQDSRATFTYDQYRRFLTELSNEKYVALSLNAMKDYYNPEKVVVGIRHDVDCHPFKAIEMADMEREFGINATYYFLATSIYYGIFKDNKMYRFHCMRNIYRYIHFTGHEVGIHNDLIAVMINHGMDPFAFNHNEIEYYRSLGIPIYGTASHGSYIASATVHNFQMFSEFAQSDEILYNGRTYPIGEYTLNEYGFDYEAYFIDYNKYYSESGGIWSIAGGVDGLLQKLKDSKPGDRIQILTHPVWWGKK